MASKTQGPSFLYLPSTGIINTHSHLASFFKTVFYVCVSVYVSVCACEWVHCEQSPGRGCHPIPRVRNYKCLWATQNGWLGTKLVSFGWALLTNESSFQPNTCHFQMDSRVLTLMEQASTECTISQPWHVDTTCPGLCPVLCRLNDIPISSYQMPPVPLPYRDSQKRLQTLPNVTQGVNLTGL